MIGQKNFGEKQEDVLAIINSLTDGLMVFNRESKLLLINFACQRFFGVKEKDVLGKSIDQFLNFSNLKNLFYLLGEEIREFSKKELEISKNLILEASSLPILKENQKIGNLVVLHDITREKKVEKMKTEFVSVSAHQLRTPLSAIKWALEVLLKERAGKLAEKQRQVVQEAYLSTERILVLVDDLLDIAKTEKGENLYKLTSADFEEVVQSVIESYQNEIRKKQIKFEFQALSDKLPNVEIDVEKMKLAVQNLLDNAIRYTPIGGLVAVTLKSGQKEMEFSIQDTGIGIPKDQQENIFTKFFRSSNALRIETEGNGLGLFIVKNIIENHQGKIWFHSEEGKGTTFYFTLPLK